MLFANEVLDALPTPRFVIRDGEVYEEHVVLDADGGFLRVDQPADALLRAAVRHVERDIERAAAGGLPLGNPAAAAVLDPGGRRPAARRRDAVRATTATRAASSTCPSAATARWSATTATARTPIRSTCPACRTSPRSWISPRWPKPASTPVSISPATARRRASCSATACRRSLEEIDAIADEAERYRRHQEIKRLTLPGEMGERFQVMGFQRGVDFRASFAAGDLSRRL